MNYQQPELIEALAAEYALGSLRGAARRRFEALRREHEAIDREAAWWEEALAGWALRIPPVDPPRRVWRQIAARVRNERKPLRSTPTAPWLAVAASILLVGVLTVFMLRPAAPPTEATIDRLAVIQSEDNAPLWQVQLVGDRLQVRHIAADDPGAERDYELWLLTDEGPVSLGLLPETGTRELSVPESLRERVQGGGSIAVSVEPDGGSPEAGPTGPVIAVAPLVTA
jgi:anti-sigma-K factor RskA